MEKQTIKMFTCKKCSRVRKHGTWMYMSHYQRYLMIKYYDIEWENNVLCEDCKFKVLAGEPIKPAP